MPSLLARFQEIIGEKLFRDKVTFAKDIVFKKTITAYSPVASEPSAGSPHPHYAVILTTDPAVTTMQTLALPAAVSGVAKRVRGRMAINSTTAGDYLQVMNAAGTERYGSATAQVNGITSESWFDAPVVGGNIYWQVNNARVTLAWLEMVSYDC
jgi:hypothetical protein